jgi:hypothetical protein
MNRDIGRMITGWGKPKYWERNLLLYLFAHHKTVQNPKE